MSENTTQDNNTEEIKLVEITGINFREAGKIYYFAPGELQLSRGDRVIVETARGVEIGTVKLPNKKVPESEIVSPLKEVTRIATADDRKKDEKNREAEMEAAIICKKKISHRGRRFIYLKLFKELNCGFEHLDVVLAVNILIKTTVDTLGVTHLTEYTTIW